MVTAVAEESRHLSIPPQPTLSTKASAPNRPLPSDYHHHDVCWDSLCSTHRVRYGVFCFSSSPSREWLSGREYVEREWSCTMVSVFVCHYFSSELYLVAVEFVQLCGDRWRHESLCVCCVCLYRHVVFYAEDTTSISWSMMILFDIHGMTQHNTQWLMAGESVQCKVVGTKASILDFWEVRKGKRKKEQENMKIRNMI